MPSPVARHVAARVWCDAQMEKCVMDPDRCERIAEIIDEVLINHVELVKWETNATLGREPDEQYKVTLKLGTRFFTVCIPMDDRLFETVEAAEEYPTGLNFVFYGHYQ